MGPQLPKGVPKAPTAPRRDLTVWVNPQPLRPRADQGRPSGSRGQIRPRKLLAQSWGSMGPHGLGTGWGWGPLASVWGSMGSLAGWLGPQGDPGGGGCFPNQLPGPWVLGLEDVGADPDLGTLEKTDGGTPSRPVRSVERLRLG